MILHVFCLERARIFLAEILVDAVTHSADLLVFTVDDGEVVQHHKQPDLRHHLFVHILPVVGTRQYGFCSRMVDDMVDVIRLELMQDRHGNSSVGKYPEEADRPVGRVASDDGHFVAFLDTGMFQQDMKLLYPAGNVFEMVSMSIVIGESGEVPMLLDASLYKA